MFHVLALVPRPYLMIAAVAGLCLTGGALHLTGLTLTLQDARPEAADSLRNRDAGLPVPPAATLIPLDRGDAG